MTKAQRNIILILVGAIVIFGSFAYWLSTSDTSTTNVFFQREMTQIQTQSSSDEIEAIEKDLLDTDLSNLDQEINDIEKELNAAY